MFDNWSIKKLLQLWSGLTMVAIIIIAAVALYTNFFFSDTQKELTDTVLPMEDASRQISAVSVAFITRQKQVMESRTQDTIERLIPREKLEDEFYRHWQTMLISVLDNEKGNKIVSSLQDYYQQFLTTDSELLELINKQHILRKELLEQTYISEYLEQKIQNQVESITGKINLQISRGKRAIRRLGDSTTSLTRKLVKEQSVIQQLSQSVRFNTLKISYLTEKLIQADRIDKLLSLRENNIRQHESTIKNDIVLLSSKLHSHGSTLVKMTQNLELNIQALMDVVVDSDNAIYNLRVKQLQNEKELDSKQQASILVLNKMVEKLDQLSSLVSYKSLYAVTLSVSVAEKSLWIIVILSVVIALGMFLFIRFISGRINTPLFDLRSAMHSLSSEQFETRLEIGSGASEFLLLAKDFNVFAENTQVLIKDLDQAKNDVEVREQHISAILNGVPEAVLTLTSSGKILSINDVAEHVLKAQRNTLVGLKLKRFFKNKDMFSSLENLEILLEESKEFEGVDYHNQPFSMWLSLNKISSFDSDIWVCVISDITAWKQTEEKLQATSREMNAILENAMVGIALIKDRVIVRVNSKFEELFSCKRGLIEGQSTRILYPSDDVYQQIGEEGYAEMSEGENYISETQLSKQDGSLFWGLISSKALDRQDPQAASIWLFEDITIQREKDEKLLNLASLDALTSLPNRNVFNDRLEHALHKAHRGSTRLALLFIDLDHFKHINDSLGHKAGDTLLCEVARRLQSCVREGDTVARLGGDEFTIILESVQSSQDVAKVADKILLAVSQLYILETTEVNISPSIGISLFPADGRDLGVLLKNADAAMYHAKDKGRNNFQFYSREMNEQAVKRLAMETSLRRALDNNEFSLHFQPQVDLATGEIFGAEALLRWQSEQWGNVPPTDFISILEDTGLISSVGEFVIEQAIKTYVLLKDKLDPKFLMAVNLSGRQFQGGELVSFVRSTLEKYNMSPSNLELEITETVLMDDSNLAIKVLNEFSDMNITLAIDDFGTGYSSLSYLKQFPVNVLKIDRSFVRDITVDSDDAAIVDAILAMSGRLNLKVVAEGVETKEQLEFLEVHQCELVQGYYFSEPLPVEQFEEFIDNANMTSLI